MLNEISQKPKTTNSIIPWGQHFLQRGMKELFGVEMFYIMIVVLVIQVDTLTQIHQILYLKLEDFIVYILCLNKPEPKTHWILWS